MPKAEKKFVLTYTASRWKLNSKKNVGAVSDSIRLCAPASLEQWRSFYYANIRSVSQIDALGLALYDHIKKDLPPEERFHPNLLSSITAQDCTEFMHTLVIDQTFNGYRKEHGLL